MREIKFRGKRFDSGEWCYGHLCENVFNKICIQPVGYWKETIAVDPDTVGQFTGRCDTNGAEIYEGDIVRWKSIPEWHSVVDHTYTICFGEMSLWSHQSYAKTVGFYMIEGSIKYGINTLDHQYIWSEVIGSIHTHPELLNQTL